jgi:hypothetical protein
MSTIKEKRRKCRELKRELTRLAHDGVDADYYPKKQALTAALQSANDALEDAEDDAVYDIAEMARHTARKELGRHCKFQIGNRPPKVDGIFHFWSTDDGPVAVVEDTRDGRVFVVMASSVTFVHPEPEQAVTGEVQP